MPRKPYYYVLLVKELGESIYAVAFGDYDQDVVEQEGYDSYPNHARMIITTGDAQSEIDAGVEEANRPLDEGT